MLRTKVTNLGFIMDLAPEGLKAAMFGLYYLIRDVVVSVAAFGGRCCGR